MTDLANRYGTPNPARRRVLVGLVGVVAAAGLGWMAWVVIYQSNPKVHSELSSFKVIDEHTVTATLTVVRRESDTDATCYLRALADDHTNVGESSTTVDSGPKRQSVTIELRTERRATAVESLGCTAPGQNARK
jgi:hypothetical protein